MKVVIIGGGPAGMLSAISAGTNKNDVTILEKMNMLGRKLLITGKGRCNITSSIPIDEFIKNVPGNGKFLYSCLNNFTNEDILNILKEEGLQTKVERGNRVFPITDKSQDVLQALLNRLKKLKVKIEVGANVKEILTEQDIVNGVKYIQGGKEKVLKADKVILATGGKSYSATGSTGDGYETDAIAAVVIGGTSLAGGKGRLWGTIVGILIMQFLSTGLDMLGVNAYYQMLVKGFVVIGAVMLDGLSSD